MTAARSRGRIGADEPLLVLCGLVMVAGPVTGGLAWALARVLERRPRIVAAIAVAGLAVAAVGGGALAEVGARAGRAVLATAADPDVGYDTAVDELVVWWLATVPLAPVLAWLVEWVAPKSVRQLERREQRRDAREQHTGVPPARLEHVDGVELGRRLGGDPVLPERHGVTVLPWTWLGRHALVLGASGSGKTETLLTLAHGTAGNPDWAVLFVDGKGDRETMRRFYGLMRTAGRQCRLFPDAAYDGWRGGPEDVAARLVEVIDFAEDGPGAYYRDQAVNLIRLACDAPGGPPRSAGELLERLSLRELADHYRGDARIVEVAAYTARQVDEVRARYSAFFGAVRGRLDGSWAFEDTDTAYLLLDGLRLKHETGRLARFLIEDFTQYAAGRKPRGRRVLLIVDELSALAAAGAGLVDVVERTRGFGVAAVLAPQVLEGIGGPEDAARIVGSAHTILLHAIPNPEDVVKVAGTRRAMETSVQHDHGRATGLGTARLQHVYKVDPNHVRQLPVGVCYAIRAGHAAKLKITQAPACPDFQLPPPAAAPPPPDPAPAADPDRGPLLP